MCMCDNHREPSFEELKEAKRQIDSIMHKLEKTIQTMESKENPQRYLSQITLAKRRYRAMMIAIDLMEKQMKNI